MTDCVLFEELVAGDYRIGVATLNAEKSLNSLSLDMVRALHPQIEAWQKDETIAAMFLCGSGDKAFCAGGDVVTLHAGSAAYGEAFDKSATESFFGEEYRLDYLIHTSAKPIVVWGDGIVMGGGIGLLSGASHRLVTETTRLAMPEITIGLYPDVGGSWFLNRTPGKTGLFLGLTGASFNAADALYVGLGDYFVARERKQALLDALCELPWSGVIADDRFALDTFFREFVEDHSAIPEGNIESHRQTIDQLCEGDDLKSIVARICAYSGDDKWLAKAAKTLAGGCPLTPWLVWEQLRRASSMTLEQVFQMELVMSVNCARLGHFKEGVRALLIDKDRQANWHPAAFTEVEAAMVDAHFEDLWNGQHPLADLGQA